jgi:hypothetical protein
MGTTGDVIKAVTAVAMVVTPMADPFDACRNVERTECTAPSPEQPHVQDPQPTQAAAERAPMAADSGRVSSGYAAITEGADVVRAEGVVSVVGSVSAALGALISKVTTGVTTSLR